MKFNIKGKRKVENDEDLGRSMGKVGKKPWQRNYFDIIFNYWTRFSLSSKPSGLKIGKINEIWEKGKWRMTRISPSLWGHSNEIISM